MTNDMPSGVLDAIVCDAVLSVSVEVDANKDIDAHAALLVARIAARNWLSDSRYILMEPDEYPQGVCEFVIGFNEDNISLIHTFVERLYMQGLYVSVTVMNYKMPVTSLRAVPNFRLANPEFAKTLHIIRLLAGNGYVVGTTSN